MVNNLPQAVVRIQPHFSGFRCAWQLSFLPVLHDGDFGFGQVVELVGEAVDLAVGGADLRFELVEDVRIVQFYLAP